MDSINEENPHRTFAELEQAVVFKEADEGCGGVMRNIGNRRGPDCSSHRIKVIIAKRWPAAKAIKVCAEALLAKSRQIARGGFIEPDQIAQHGPEARGYKVALLREQTAQIAGIFKFPMIQRNCKTHDRFARRHVQMAK